MKRVLAQYKNWLLPAVLILFILQAVTFPFALGESWAGRSETPDHLLTYTRNRLTWDAKTTVDENGVAQLSLFDSEYGDPVTVKSDSKVVAPGTDKQTTVRLYNRLARSVTYKVVLYQYQENIDENIPENSEIDMKDKLHTKLLAVDDGRGFGEDKKPALPEGVTEDQVIRAVTGNLQGHHYQDFDISWFWDFEAEGEDEDQMDTLLGSLAAEGKNPNTTVGMYIVVVDNNSDIITPESPKTGDSGIGAYLALMAVTGGLLVFLLWEKRKVRQCED